MKKYSSIIMTALLIVVLSANVYGQIISKKVKEKPSFYFESGYSATSIKLLGKTPDTQTFYFQAGYLQKTRLQIKNAPILYSFSVIPIIKYNYQKRDDGGRKDKVSGFGLSPIGLHYHKQISSLLAYKFSVAGGLILIDKKFPTEKGRRLNFTFELSPTLYFTKFEQLHFSLGYKFHHISNAQTGDENPGIDSNFLTFTITLLK